MYVMVRRSWCCKFWLGLAVCVCVSCGGLGDVLCVIVWRGSVWFRRAVESRLSQAMFCDVM